MKRDIAIVVGAAILSVALLALQRPLKVAALGPSVTVAQWDQVAGCVSWTRWTYGIEELVKQMRRNVPLVAGVAAVVLALFFLEHPRRASALGPSVTVAEWDDSPACVAFDNRPGPEGQ